MKEKEHELAIFVEQILFTRRANSLRTTISRPTNTNFFRHYIIMELLNFTNSIGKRNWTVNKLIKHSTTPFHLLLKQ